MTRLRPFHLALLIPAAALTTSLWGCASKEAQRDASAPASTAEVAATGATADDGEEARRDEVRAVGVEALVRTNNAFAFDLFRATRAPHQVVSPHGVATALALLHAGAEDATAAQIRATLRADLGEQDLQEKFGALHEALRSRASVASREQPRGFRLRVVPGVWLSDEVQPMPAFVNTARGVHAATVQALDFTATSAATAAINAHHSEASGGRIDAVANSLGELTRLFVTTTVQWDAPWALPFERARTREATFAASSGPRSVPMMQGRLRTGYLDGDGFDVVELPYGDGLVSAWVLLPDEGREEIDGTLTADFFDWIVASARQREVEVRLPRFELTSRMSLRAALGSMGMPNAFDPARASFGRLAAASEGSALFVDDVVAVTRMRVDEDGSDAAAPFGGSSGPAGAPIATLAATRPFLVVVRDAPTGAVLAVARISEP